MRPLIRLKYTKPSLTCEQQADQLIARGLIADRAQLIEQLCSVSYYRPSGYWLPFKQADESFLPRTTFEEVWRRYVFDRRLRLLVMDPIERVEVALRSRIVQQMTQAGGPFAYVDPANFAPSVFKAPHSGTQRTIHEQLLAQVEEASKRSSEVFVIHYRTKYSSMKHLPFWMAAEVVTFGCVLTCYKHLKPPMQKQIARGFRVPAPVFQSWLQTITYVRNACAHHSRFWDRELSVKPCIPNPHTIPAWHTPITIPNNRPFAVLSVLRYLLQQIAPQSKWDVRLLELLLEFEDLPLSEAGFFDDWEHSGIWSGVSIP
ncbi:MAG: Abi family protein [Candidatus Sumerlaeaceae bacterium]